MTAFSSVPLLLLMESNYSRITRINHTIKCISSASCKSHSTTPEAPMLSAFVFLSLLTDSGLSFCPDNKGTTSMINQPPTLPFDLDTAVKHLSARDEVVAELA